MALYNSKRDKFGETFNKSIDMSIFCDLLLDFLGTTQDKIIKNP